MNYLSCFLKKRKKAEMYYENMSKFCKDGSAILLGAFCKNVLVGFHWAYEINFLGAETDTQLFHSCQ